MSAAVITFAKRPPLHWLSHLDVQTAWNYALRRSGLPVRYSEGFNPQPRLSVIMPLEVGIRSEVELLTVLFAAPFTTTAITDALRPQLPAGFVLQAVRPVPPPYKPPTMAQVGAVSYAFTTTLPPAAVLAAQAAAVTVSRARETGPPRVFVITEEVRAAAVAPAGNGSVLTCTLRVRPAGMLRATEYAAACGITAENSVDFVRTGIHFSDGAEP